MRKCIRCNCEMKEGFGIRVERSDHNIMITKGTGNLFSSLGKPRIAICPQCGEISMYLKHVSEIADD